MWYWAEYSSFSVGPETDKYRLSVSGFSGDAGDAIANPVRSRRICNGMQFTTPDQDNDLLVSGICVLGETGWWFNRCSRSYVNLDGNAVWNAYSDDLILDVQFARMLVKFD